MPELLLRSLDATWNAERWESLDHSGIYRYEVIDGVLYMLDTPIVMHAWVSNRTARLLWTQLDDTGNALTLPGPVGVFMPGCDSVLPDFVVLDPAWKDLLHADRLVTVPRLLVEILSSTNHDHDLVTKRAAYARAGVPEYWILRPVERDVLVHWEPEPATGLYLQVRHIVPGGELVSPTLRFRAPVASFFAKP
jgi:Uma2 family endonuclease